MLRPEQDAYGLLVSDHLRGVNVVEIIERDDGYIDTSSGPPAYFAPFPEWPAHQREAMRHLRGPVLDIGCGAGRVSLYAQELGLQVVATDVSPLAIETCRKRGARCAEVVPITRLSRALGVFATIVMYGNNWGLMGSPERARWLLRRFRGFTEPGALVIAESCDPHKTVNTDHLSYQQRNRERGRLPGQIRIRVRHRTARTPWFDYLLVSPDEMASIVSGTGWEIGELLMSDGPAYTAVIARVC